MPKPHSQTIMKLQKRLLFLGALVATSLVACNHTQPSSQPEPDNHVNVFVLSGQSNMEGSTTYVSDKGDQWLRNAFEKLNEDYSLDLDITPFEDADGNVTKNAPGVPEVLTSYYGFYPPSGPNAAHASNTTDKLAGKFMPTNVAMGSQERFMGPEIGMSMVLKAHASEDKPIYFIKCAFSGSGFRNSAPNWAHDSTFNGYNKDNNLYVIVCL